jgi:uncharacterized protein
MADDISVEAVTITTGDGLALHGDVPVPAPCIAAAAIAHPHPRMGGDRHNAVVESLFRSLPRVGVAALRFDFRGVGRSEGMYGGGIDERLDAAAALATLADRIPDQPLWSVGYSFGGDVALSVDDPRLSGWVSVAAPLSVVAEPPVAACDDRPTVLVVPAHDQFLDPEAARRAVVGWNAVTVIEVAMADHFLVGRLAEVVDVVTDAIVGFRPDEP